MAKDTGEAAVLAAPKANRPPHVRVGDTVTFVNFAQVAQPDVAVMPDGDADFKDPDVPFEKKTWQPEYPARVTSVYEGGRVVNLRVDNGERWGSAVRGDSGTEATLTNEQRKELTPGLDLRGFDVSKVHWAPVVVEKGERMVRPRSWHAVGD